MEQQLEHQDSYVRIRKQPWYTWLTWLVWAGLLVFLIQNALGSAAEMEPRAAMIFWVSTGVVFLAGIVIAFVRANR